MSNIREDKGYTYGIGSWIISRKDLGYFAISTEVGADVYQDALSEIYYEIDLLTTELIEEDELEVVRNYKMGSLLKGFDGPFSRADKLRGLLNYGLDTSYYDGYIKKILTIKPEELNDVAKRYLQAGTFYEVVAGKI
ncbi:MAG: insulinase family protein [Sphingobacteriales bacterium JAD_PAG50586_3]|nr:MAG: insulinase family protein [Sphingobacteriales bacterium JAD_PAG50586_3]